MYTLFFPAKYGKTEPVLLFNQKSCLVLIASHLFLLVISDQ